VPIGCSGDTPLWGRVETCKHPSWMKRSVSWQHLLMLRER
jgi:hypothetical protein